MRNFGLTAKRAKEIYDNYMRGFNGLKRYIEFRKKEQTGAWRIGRYSGVFNTISTNQKNCIPKESHLGVVENNKYSYIKISQLILTGSRGKSALLIPTTNLHYQK